MSQYRSTSADDARGESEYEPDERPTNFEANEADAAEQRQNLQEEDAYAGYRDSLPDDADPADAADQGREIELDEDDYR